METRESACELEILNQIAEKHELGEFFRDRVRQSKRCLKKVPFEGSGINASAFFLDANSYHIFNIFDAAYAVQNIYNVYSDFKLSFLVKMIARSLIYKCRTMGKGNSFPPEVEWGRSSQLNE